MNKSQFSAIADVLVDRWPFDNHESEASYVKRLWLRAAGWRGASIARFRTVVENLVDDKHRGRARPSVEHVVGSVLSHLSDDGRDAKAVQNETASKARKRHNRSTREAWDLHDMCSLVTWSPSLEASFAALRPLERTTVRRLVSELPAAERNSSSAYRLTVLAYREQGGVLEYLRRVGRDRMADDVERGS